MHGARTPMHGACTVRSLSTFTLQSCVVKGSGSYNKGMRLEEGWASVEGVEGGEDGWLSCPFNFNTVNYSYDVSYLCSFIGDIKIIYGDF